MAGFLDKETIEIPCENCRRKTKKSIGWIKSNKSFTCSCGTVVKLEADQLKREILKMEAQYEKLQRSLKSFGR